MRNFCPRSFLPALALLAAFSGAAAMAQDYHTKNLTPQHVEELRGQIRQCYQRAVEAQTAEERCVAQEEMCKKLLQVEDYDTALKVASDVVQNRGCSPERRAAHHFMIAQIYVLKMQAATTDQQLQQNRNAALRAANDVINRRYNRAWGITDEAQKIVSDLNDPAYMQNVQGWLSKRQSGGVDRMGEQAAAAQTYAMQHNAAVGQSPRTAGTVAGMGADVQSVSQNSFAAGVGQLQTSRPAGGRSIGTNGVAPYAVSGTLAQPRRGLVIDGTTVKPADAPPTSGMMIGSATAPERDAKKSSASSKSTKTSKQVAKNSSGSTKKSTAAKRPGGDSEASAKTAPLQPSDAMANSATLQAPVATVAPVYASAETPGSANPEASRSWKAGRLINAMKPSRPGSGNSDPLPTNDAAPLP